MRLFVILLLCLGVSDIVVGGDGVASWSRASHVDNDEGNGPERGCDGCDDDGDDCSPVCPTCVYAQSIRVVPPATPSVHPLVDIGVWVVLGHRPVPMVHVTSPPAAPALEGVFHPPRLARANLV